MPHDRVVPLLVTLGDSLTDGFVLPIEQAWPALAVARLARRGLAGRLVNAGVSGDTD